MGRNITLERNQQSPFELEVLTPHGEKSVALLLAEEVRKDLGIKETSQIEPGSYSQWGYRRILSLNGVNLEFEGRKYDDINVLFTVCPLETGGITTVFSKIEFVNTKDGTTIASWDHPAFRASNLEQIAA